MVKEILVGDVIVTRFAFGGKMKVVTCLRVNDDSDGKDYELNLNY